MKRHSIPFLLVPVILIMSCAVTHYDLGRDHMERGAWNPAIEEFKLALREEGARPALVRDLGIALLYQGNDRLAIPILRKAFEADSTDGRTLLYLGAAHEVRREFEHAMEYYRRYRDLSPLEGIRRQMEGRLAYLMRKKMAQEARSLLAQETTLSSERLSDSTVAVLHFHNLGNKKGLDPLQKGLAEMLITDLSKVKSLKMVERERLQILLDEMGLGQTGLVDESTAPRVGLLLGASKLVNGNFIDLTQLGIRMEAGLIGTRESRTLAADHVEGKFVRLFHLEKNLVFKVIDSMGIRLSQTEKDEIAKIPTENLLAFMAYCQGLDYEDRGRFDQAARSYERALQIDPNYLQASKNLKRSQTIQAKATKLGDLNQLAKLSPAEKNKPRVHGGRRGHLTHMGRVINGRFMPGIDQRKPVEEAIEGEADFGAPVNFIIEVEAPPRRQQ